MFVRWDSGYYAVIADVGYPAGGDERAFYPLYPMLVGVLARISQASLYTVGLVVSTVGYLCAAWGLFAWSRLNSNETVARYAVLWLVLFPMSFFLAAFYAESLFLAFSLWGLVYLQRGRFVASGLLICMAGLTRPHGFLLAVPYFTEGWLQWLDVRERPRAFVIGALIAPLGTLAHLVGLEQRGANGVITETYFQVLARGWKTYLTYPWQTLWDGARGALFGQGIQEDWFSRATTLHDFLYVVGGVALAVWALKHLRLSAGLYLLAGVLLFFFTHGPYGYAFESYPRHIASIAPLYLALALLLAKWHPWVRASVLTFSAAQLALLTAWFASARWVA